MLFAEILFCNCLPAENEFLGKKIEVKQAKNSQRPVIIPSGGGGGHQHNNSGAASSRSGNLNQLSVGSPGKVIYVGIDGNCRRDYICECGPTGRHVWSTVRS